MSPVPPHPHSASIQGRRSPDAAFVVDDIVARSGSDSSTGSRSPSSSTATPSPGLFLVDGPLTRSWPGGVVHATPPTSHDDDWLCLQQQRLLLIKHHQLETLVVSSVRMLSPNILDNFVGEHLETMLIGESTRQASPWTPILDINDRAQMDDLMSLPVDFLSCEMASEVLGQILPPLPATSFPLAVSTLTSSGSRSPLSLVPADHIELLEHQAHQIARYLGYWASLTPHPLCVLIAAVLYLERLKRLHPALSANGHTKDTGLRVIFSAVLLASKWLCDVSHSNRAYVRRTPWTLFEINSMEREMLDHLSYDVFISAKEMLHRAKGFWTARGPEQARYGADDGSASFSPAIYEHVNHFLEGRTMSPLRPEST